MNEAQHLGFLKEITAQGTGGETRYVSVEDQLRRYGKEEGCARLCCFPQAVEKFPLSPQSPALISSFEKGFGI